MSLGRGDAEPHDVARREREREREREEEEEEEVQATFSSLPDNALKYMASSN
jgi:hypothetical protein